VPNKVNATESTVKVKVALEIYNMKRLKELTILFLRYNIS
jgi:hypothetical protein